MPLGQAHEGISGALAILGEPGIGKTALLQYAASRAGGMRVLHATGSNRRLSPRSPGCTYC